MDARYGNISVVFHSELFAIWSASNLNVDL